MPVTPKIKPAEKQSLHPRNAHRGQYNFKELCASSPGLKAFVFVNQYHTETIDFSNADAVKALNNALLKHFYGVDNWDIPAGYLCPPIPGRADYIHYMADLLASTNNNVTPTGDGIKVLDIGVGANCVYPLIGNSVYGWHFTGTDIDSTAIRSAQSIIAANPHLQNAIDLRLQGNSNDILKGAIKPGELFHLTICNPPFHASLKEARAATSDKWKNLGIHKYKEEALNFGGHKTELWYHGGESAFISIMIHQSTLVAKQCLWFTTLVSQKETLPAIYKALKNIKAAQVKTIAMAQGQKVSRVVAWSFLTDAEMQQWYKK